MAAPSPALTPLAPRLDRLAPPAILRPAVQTAPVAEDQPRPRLRPNRAAALFATLVFLALAAFETHAALTASERVATDADWAAAAAEVRAGFRPGDLIVFAPAWVDQVGRRHLGDLIPVEMAARADASRYARIWEVSVREARAPEARDALFQHANEHGLVRVALYERRRPPVIPLYDFTAHLDDARLTQLASDGKSTLCPRDGDAFRCATTRVERRTLEVDYRPRRGILAPVDGKLTTRVEFARVPMGRSLVGYTALHDYYSRKNSDAPVEFTVYVDGVRVFSRAHRNEDGWSRFVVDTTPWTGGEHTVRFDVRAANPAWRTFGYTAETRPHPPEDDAP